jgi:site-specific DNA-methyltransferase (adenine-specific)
MVSKVLYSSASEEWGTPHWLFDLLNRRFHFTLDACATPENAKCKKYFTKERDGLRQDWDKHVVFCNPPYGRAVGKWVRKCYEASFKGALVVLVIPARLDTAWYHAYVKDKSEEFPLKGRVAFDPPPGKKQNGAPFPTMIVVYGRRDNRRLMMCQRCDRLFHAQRRDAKTCSERCRKALSRHT